MLRKPIGEYNVGITRYQTESARRVPYTIYYPSLETGTETPYANVDYLYGKKDGNPRENDVHTFCYQNVPFLPGEDKHRVILFSHGLCGYEMECTVLCADLASLGYVVVSLGHPIGSPIVAYEDGSFYEWDQPETITKTQLKEMIPLWKEDFESVMDELSKHSFANRLMLTEFDLLGMSLGGNAAIFTGLSDTRIRHVINLDGRLFTLPEFVCNQPEILIYCGRFSLLAYLDLQRSHYPKLQVVTRKGLSHYLFCDGLFLSDKGKQNPDWADRERSYRTQTIQEFLK